MKIVICDDNEQEVDRYKKLLLALSEKYHVNVDLFVYTNADKVVFELEYENSPTDVLYLDINMPHKNGIALAQEVKNIGYRGEIVFLTFSQKHFLDAFDLHAFNYIVKESCSDERFENIFIDVLKKVRENDEDYMMLTCCGERAVVPIKSIQYFESLKRILTVFYDDEKFEFYSTLGKIEEELVGKGFVRVHRSYLVSLSFINKIVTNSLFLKNGTEIPVGRTYRNMVVKMHKSYLENKGAMI